MKKGFNIYNNQHNEEQQQSEAAQNNNNNNINNAYHHSNINVINQIANFSPNNGYSQNMIMTLFQLVQQQSRALQNLFTKVQFITAKTFQLSQKIKNIKKIKRQERQTDLDQVRKEIMKSETVKSGGDIVEASALIKILFGEDKNYQYKLRLAQKLQLPLYRERNFFLEIQLVDLEGNVVKNFNKIPLSLALYSSQNPPKFIEKNTAGQKILKGYIEQSLHQSVCRFQKIQIKQVTSHFRNGWVFLVIIPSMTPLGCASNTNQKFINYTKIQPLVLQKIIVKAKKIKQNKKHNDQVDKQGGIMEQMQEEGQHKNSEQIYMDEK